MSKLRLPDLVNLVVEFNCAFRSENIECVPTTFVSTYILVYRAFTFRVGGCKL